MEDVTATLLRVWRESGAASSLRIIGGLAVRLEVGAASRVTHDIDLVVMDADACRRLVVFLKENSYNVAELGHLVACAARSRRPIDDVALNPVVMPRTFDELSMASAPEIKRLEDEEVALVERHDLARLKLGAARDQDLVDLGMLARYVGLEAEPIARAANCPASGGNLMPHRYVVLAERVRGFDTLEEAERFARMNYPAVICERRAGEGGSPELVEIARHDLLYDEERDEWRVMMGRC